MPAPGASARLRFELALSAESSPMCSTRRAAGSIRTACPGYHDLPRKTVDLVEALAAIAQSSDIAAYLAQPQPGEPSISRSCGGARPAARGSRRQGCEAAYGAGAAALAPAPARHPLRVPEPARIRSQLFQRHGRAADDARRHRQAATPRPISSPIAIKEVIYNPYWNVPRSIVINEMLPKLWRDPSYLDRLGYEVSNSRGREVASSAVDWAAVATHADRHRRAPAAGPRQRTRAAEDRFSQQATPSTCTTRTRSTCSHASSAR